MVETINIEVSSNKYHLKLTLKSKITCLTGNSATGKSTLKRLVAQIGSPTVQIKISNKAYQIANITERDLIRSDRLEYAIWVVDEDLADLIRNPEYALRIQRAKNCYFIIIGRYNISTLNYSPYDIYELIKTGKELEVKPFIITSTRVVNKSETIISKCVLEDTGQAKDWFEKLFNGNIEISTPLKAGKEQVCKTVRLLAENTSKDINILILFDVISFGSCASAFKDLIDEYGYRLFQHKQYKSWEYLMLRTNMFRKKFKEYSLDETVFEERYYEEQLQLLSNSSFGTIKHSGGGSKISDCYTEPCCAYNKSLSEISIGEQKIYIFYENYA